MGLEHRLRVRPALADLGAPCDAVCAAGTFRRIETSLVEQPGVGIALADGPANASWPQVADLCLEPDGVVYVVCHVSAGAAFLRALVEHLETRGHAVDVDDDV